MKVGGDWLDRPQTQAVLAAFAAAETPVYFVGGCVRNAVLGMAVADVDLATPAPPKAVAALGRAAGLKVVPTGIEHGTVTLVAGGIPHEVTTFRRDVQTDGRRAVVAFSGEMAEDARRRDFTMNALYARPDGTVLDPLGTGLEDTRARRVRFIEDPAKRIAEDHLRILRFFRFHAWYGDPAGGLDAEGLAACAAAIDGLDALSRERVGTEMLKLLAAPDPAPAVAALAAAGGLARVLPGADARALAVLVALEADAGVAPDPLRRLALLGGEDPGKRLRLSKAQARRLAAVRAALEQGEGAAAAGYRHGAQVALDAGLIAAALAGQLSDPALAAEAERGAAQRLPVRPADLMPALQGPALGRRLAELEEAWIASNFTLTRGDLLNRGTGGDNPPRMP